MYFQHRNTFWETLSTENSANILHVQFSLICSESTLVGGSAERDQLPVFLLVGPFKSTGVFAPGGKCGHIVVGCERIRNTPGICEHLRGVMKRQCAACIEVLHMLRYVAQTITSRTKCIRYFLSLDYAAMLAPLFIQERTENCTCSHYSKH